MKVEVAVPQDFLGGVIGDLHSRRGEAEHLVDGNVYAVVSALVPACRICLAMGARYSR